MAFTIFLQVPPVAFEFSEDHHVGELNPLRLILSAL